MPVVPVTLTGVSGEFTTIPFRTVVDGVASEPLEAAEASIPRGLARKKIQATTPDGVATLDIVFELRTGQDAE